MIENSQQQTHLQSAADVVEEADRHNLRSAHAIPFSQRLSCTIAEACAATGLGRTKLYELIGAGSVETTLIGRRRLVSMKSLLRLTGGK